MEEDKKISEENTEKDKSDEHKADDLEAREKKIINFFKKEKNWAIYIALVIITYIGVYIRTLNISKLKDITTGTWTLGPDLDPFLFLRWAKYIVAHGSLMTVDMMRYVPIGYPALRELRIHSYLIAWLNGLLSIFSKNTNITYSAIIYPVVMFALMTIAFFLFARKIFYKEEKTFRNVIALIATTIFVLVPSLLPRTIAGIPEKESGGFFFLFLALYLFLEAITSEKLKRGVIFGILAGVSTAMMALTWGGMVMLFFSIPPAVLIAFMIGKVKKKEFLIYSSWLISSFVIMMPNLKFGIILKVFSANSYSIGNLIDSTTTSLSVIVFALIGISLLVMNSKNERVIKIKKKFKIPEEITALIISAIALIILGSIILGPGFFINKISDVEHSLLSPLVSRFGITVAENKQPYFTDWSDSFGPMILSIPIFFWMFFIGSIVLFYDLVKKLDKKNRTWLTSIYFIFLVSLIFSRYSSSSILDGENSLSILIYFGGMIFFVCALAYFYYKMHKENTFALLKELNIAIILYILVITLGMIAARGAIRFIMILGAVVPVAIAFLVVKTFRKFFSEKNETKKLFLGIAAIILILSSIFMVVNYYQQDKVSAENFAPGPYQWQWQKAMQWVRENTSENAVFAHWWDYGYWVQSIGERATVLDGSNSIGYWNYLMGRNVLTGTNESESLDFLYAHNTTHLLIDSTDIGKYTAFSSIGSNENYDRYAWIPTFLMDTKQTQESKNETVYVYMGGAALDEDILWNQDGNQIFLPKKKAGIGAIIVVNNGTLTQPEGVFVYNGNQYRIPLRYSYFDNKLHDFGSGINAGVFIFPTISPSSNNLNMNNIGALMYFSNRTIDSGLVQLYLFDKQSNYFKLAHTESSFIIGSLRNQGVNIGEFVYYQGIQGPIKIWSVSYPSNIKLNPDYLQTNYPNPKVDIANPGEY